MTLEQAAFATSSRSKRAAVREARERVAKRAARIAAIVFAVSLPTPDDDAGDCGSDATASSLLERPTAELAEPAYEITIVAVDRPRLYRQLVGIVGELALSINEAHGVCGADGLVQNTFLVDGWMKNAEALRAALQAQLAELDASGQAAPLPRPPDLPAVQIRQSLDEGAASNDWEIDASRLTIVRKIASGSCGEVFKGVYNGQQVAVKVLREISTESIAEFMKELSVMRKVRHRNIVQLIGAITSVPRPRIIVEFCERGSLLDYLHSHHPLPDGARLRVALDVASGMDYLHRCNIVHRDLKAANLLLTARGECKVADFGVSRLVDPGREMTAETGTYRWMAPEVVAHALYDTRCDVFSFGIVLWEIAAGGAQPYAGMSPLQAAVGVMHRGLRPPVPPGTQPALAAIMVACWQAGPEVRPDFSALVAQLEALVAHGDGGGDGGAGAGGVGGIEDSTSAGSHDDAGAAGTSDGVAARPEQQTKCGINFLAPFAAMRGALLRRSPCATHREQTASSSST